jgi:hypothetical protein
VRPVLIARCDGVGKKPVKQPTPGQAAPGLEPETSRVQTGALGAWPRSSVISIGADCESLESREDFLLTCNYCPIQAKSGFVRK